jgi:hypothetical protein
MHGTDPRFFEPENKSIKVWRYLDFTKFVALLETESLHFACPRTFEDKFEASLPTVMLKVFRKKLNDLEWEAFKKTVTETKLDYAINCWHANEYESAAMWKLYLKSNEGIAVQSTYSSLVESIIDTRTVNAGYVQYIDPEKLPVFFSTPFMLKRLSFEHEHEIRLVTGRSADEDNVSIKVDLNILIHKVYVAPDSPDWVCKLVTSVRDRYKLNFEIERSKLYDSPYDLK